jgi:hypothetical protein
VSLDLRRKRDLAGILDDAFALFGARWRLFVLVGLAVAVPVDVVVLGAGLGWLWEDWDAKAASADAVPIAVANFVVTLLLTAVAVDAVVAEAEGRRRGAREALRRCLESFGALLWPMLGVAAGLAIGAVAFFVPAIVVAVFTAVVPQAVLVDRARGAAALRRSAALVTGRGWWVLAVQATTGLVLAVGLVTLGLGADALARALDARAVTIAGVAVGQVAAVPLLALVTTLLYFTLRVDKGEERGIPGTTPWERRLAEGWLPPT